MILTKQFIPPSLTWRSAALPVPVLATEFSCAWAPYEGEKPACGEHPRRPTEWLTKLTEGPACAQIL